MAVSSTALLRWASPCPPGPTEPVRASDRPTTSQTVAAAALPSRRQEETRVGRRDRGHPRCGTQQPVPLRWTADSIEPKEAA